MKIFETFEEDTPLWLFERLALTYNEINSKSNVEKYMFLAKLYFYTQQDKKDLNFCYRHLNIVRTKTTDKIVYKEIQLLKNWHKDLKQLQNDIHV
jgi:hypothetical protein